MSLFRYLGLILAAGILSMPPAARAGVEPSVTAYAGLSRFNQESPLNIAVPFGVRAGLTLGRRIGIEGSYGRIYGSSDLGSGTLPVETFGADLLLYSHTKSRLRPFLFGGMAQLNFRQDTGEPLQLRGTEVGAGFKFGLFGNWDLRFDLRDLIARSGVPLEDAGALSHHFFVTVGLTLGLSRRPRDTDGDGVLDRVDRCPSTPPGAQVDALGCEVDSDGDGVADGLDQCPETPYRALVDSFGCPQDGDGDGVLDGIDLCNKTPAGVLVDVAGCALDTDGDGVFDGLDQCPDTLPGTRVGSTGCPIQSE